MATPLTVEFVGSPGAGKTRLYRGVLGDLGQAGAFELAGGCYRGVKTNTPGRSMRLLLNMLPPVIGTKITERITRRGLYSFEALNRFLLEHGDFIQAVMPAMLARLATLPEPQLFMSWITQLSARYQLAMEGLGDGSILLLDEGFANRGVGLFGFDGTQADEADVRNYARAIPRPDALVLVYADVETCKDRLERRGWTRRSRALSAAGKLAFLESSRFASETIADELGRQDVTVIRVRSEDGDDGYGLVSEALKARRAVSVPSTGGGARN